MRKNFIKPAVVCRASIRTQSLMTISGNGDIPFAGIDNGLNTPGSRHRNKLWDDEDDDDIDF